MSKSYQKKYRENMSDEQKLRYRDNQKKYRDNMTDEQKQKKREANKRYRDNMSDEWKKKLRDCNWTRTHNHLVHKRTLSHLAKLAK